MLKLFLWLRYLRKIRMVLLSIGAVCLSVSLLIVVASLFSGFIEAFEQSAVELMGDAVLAAPVKFSKYPLFIDRLKQLEDVEAATAVLTGQGLLHLGRGNVRAVEICGIEPVSREQVCGFKQSLLVADKSVEGEFFDFSSRQEKAVGYLGIGLVTEPDPQSDEYDFDAARQMIGRDVVLITGTLSRTQQQKSTSAQVKRRTVKFTVADIVFTGIYGFDSSFIYLPIGLLQRVLYPNETEQVASQIQIKLTEGADTEMALAQIRGLWRKFAAEELGWGQSLIGYTGIETSRQMQSRQVAELRKQMGMLLLIFGVVSFSVVVLVFCIFYMIVMTKQKDIAIIKSCGGTSGSLAAVFVGFGGCVGVIGSAFGVAIGYIVTKNLNIIEQWITIIFGLKLWKSSVYIFSRIPNQVDWNWACVIGLSAVAAAAVGALIPALVAAGSRPVNILRYE